jgi:ankyrin repeat protein
MSTENINREIHSATEDLWRIAEAGDTRNVESVLAAGVDIDASNSHGMTALMRAASQGRAEMVRLLLKHGADPNRTRNDKFTALVLASFFGHEEIVKILVEHGANIDATTRYGTSAQGWASARTFPDVAEYLKTTGVEHGRTQDQKATPDLTTVEVKEPTMAVPGSVEELQAADAIETEQELPNGPEAFECFDDGAVETPVESPQPPETFENFPAIFAVASKPLNRRQVIYAFATLLLAFVLFAHLTLRTSPSLDVVSTDTPPPTSTNPAPNATNMMSAIEAKPTAPAELKVEKLESSNLSNSEKKPEKEKDATVSPATRSLVSTGSPAARQIPEQRNDPVSVSQAPPTPAEPKFAESKDVRDAVLTTAPAVTTKSTAVATREPIPKMRPVPSTTQLLTGTKSADKGREIRWP